MEYDSGHLGYPMYGGSYESDVALSRKLEGRSKWVEFDKSPDIDKTLDDSRNLTSEEDEEKSVSKRKENLIAIKKSIH